MTEEEAIRNFRQVLWRTIDSLATGPEGIQARLLSPTLLLAGPLLGLHSLPQEAQRELRQIRQDLLSKITTDDECSRLAGRILGLYRSLTPEI